MVFIMYSSTNVLEEFYRAYRLLSTFFLKYIRISIRFSNFIALNTIKLYYDSRPGKYLFMFLRVVPTLDSGIFHERSKFMPLFDAVLERRLGKNEQTDLLFFQDLIGHLYFGFVKFKKFITIYQDIIKYPSYSMNFREAL